MYYISDYKKRAINKIIPYLIDFPKIVKIIENDAERYQAIEDVLWKIAENFWVSESRGIFLTAHANNELVDLIYTDKAEDAFTYGTDKPQFQAYGTGHYYSQASYISGIKKTPSEEKLIRAVLAKIIQNNTNGTIEDFREALKLCFNAEKVDIYESNPLNVSVMLYGKSLELSSSGVRDTIKGLLPVCVSLKNVYTNPYTFDTFIYDENSSYGEYRYPVLVGETTDIYNYISFSINLDEQFEEHIITNHDKFDKGMFCCFTGSLEQLNNNGTYISSTDSTNNYNFSLKNVYDETSQLNKIAIEHNGQIYYSNIEAIADTRYTFIIYNDIESLKCWILSGVQITGESLEKDLSFINNRIFNSTPDINIDNFETIEAPIYINCEHTSSGNINFNNFTYYAIIFGNSISLSEDVNNINLNATEYYASCYGEKQILFNCLANNNHLFIHTNDPLSSNIPVKQSYYNYKAWHSHGRYMYLDGKSGIVYNFSEDIPSSYNLNNFEISFDICMPLNLKDGNIVSDIFDNESKTRIYIDSENKTIKLDLLTTFEDEEGVVTTNVETHSMENNIIDLNEYCNIKIKLEEDGSIYFYKNNEFINSSLTGNLYAETINNLRIGFDKNLTNYYNGFIKNFRYIINGTRTTATEEILNYNVDLSIPYKNTLKDINKEIKYTNFGARFITVPQLITDNTKKDLYNNDVIGIR